MRTVSFQLQPLTCPSCIAKIERTMAKRPGVSQANVLFNASKVKITFDEAQVSADQLSKVLDDLGYPVLARV
ncbi:MAG: heavy-metal-associated domain-containing protein [Bacillota bacterium]